MKKRIFIPILLLILALTGCIKDEPIKLYPELESKASFNLNSSATISKMSTITVAELNNQINSIELPTKGKIEEISIQSISIQSMPTVSNKATSAKVSLKYTSYTDGSIIYLGKDVDFSNLNDTKNLQSVLTKEVVADINKFLADLLNKKITTNFTQLSFQLEGTSMPADANLTAKVDVILKLNIVYSQSGIM